MMTEDALCRAVTDYGGAVYRLALCRLACAACALALAVGTVSVRPAGNGGNNRRAGTEHIILFCKFNYLFHGLIIIVVRVYLVN